MRLFFEVNLCYFVFVTISLSGLRLKQSHFWQIMMIVEPCMQFQVNFNILKYYSIFIILNKYYLF